MGLCEKSEVKERRYIFDPRLELSQREGLPRINGFGSQVRIEPSTITPRLSIVIGESGAQNQQLPPAAPVRHNAFEPQHSNQSPI